MFARLLIPAAIGLGAALLFQIQPLVAKWFLPWFGGAASVWTACMLFFQVVLVGGYLYAHGLISRLSPKRQAAVHLGLLGLALAGLVAAAFVWPSPLTPGPAWKPPADAAPLARLLGLLALSVGLPYLTVATTGPLLQAWFVRLRPGRSPYPLYAVSNAGSLLGLLSYPVIVEPRLTVPAQAWLWAGGFAVYAALTATAAVAQARAGAPADDLPKPPDSVPAAASAPFAAVGLASWLAFSATASLALLAVTNQLTLDVAPIPFLWVAPLAIYVVTFIVCFGGPRRYSRKLWGTLLVASAAATAFVLIRGTEVVLGLQIGMLLVLLLSLCMVCHGELATHAPHPSRLTSFYLALSVGGALGGFLAAVVAPALFRGLWELPIAIYLGVFLLLTSLFRDRPAQLFGSPGRQRSTLAATAVALIGLGSALGWAAFSGRSSVVASARNFYGWFVVVREAIPGHPGDSILRLLHGRIAHGEQIDAPGRSRYPTTYYGPSSGVGLAIRSAVKDGGDASRGIRVGVVGLGVGTLGAWARPQDVYRFYEINPAVIALSTGPHPLFTFLSNPGGKREVVLGDARLSLESEPPQRYDVLVLDAFSSDAIPVHLLTREAFAIYRRHIAGPRSVIAVHISNRHIDLEPIVRAIAKASGLYGVTVAARPEEARAFASQWLLLSRSRERLEAAELAPFGAPWDGPASPGRPWTDTYSNVLGALRVFRVR